MNLYPLNLVLAVALASATLCLGYLPPRLLAAPFFTRWTLRLAAGWLALAAITPPEILHYYVLLALLGFFAWWRLRGDHGFPGKLWLCAAAGFGISLGPVLILAVTPGAWPVLWPVWARALFLASLYTGGAIPGLAFVLWIFTRREAIDSGVKAWNYTRLLIALVLVRTGCELLDMATTLLIRPNARDLYPEFAMVALALDILVLLPVAFLVSKLIRSPRPSTAGLGLFALTLAGLAAEILALM
jgi:hypothetical protein